MNIRRGVFGKNQAQLLRMRSRLRTHGFVLVSKSRYKALAMRTLARQSYYQQVAYFMRVRFSPRTRRFFRLGLILSAFPLLYLAISSSALLHDSVFYRRDLFVP